MGAEWKQKMKLCACVFGGGGFTKKMWGGRRRGVRIFFIHPQRILNGIALSKDCLIWQDRVERVQRERKQRVQEVCNLYAKKKPQASYPFVPWNLYVDERNQFIYCAIGKVGSTSWLMKMAGSAPRNRSYGMTALDISELGEFVWFEWIL